MPTSDRLTADERRRLGSLTARVSCERVRLHRGGSGAEGALRRAVLWASRGRAVALGNHVFLPDRFANSTFSPGSHCHVKRSFLSLRH